jgi:hypothetical protein
MDGICIYGQPPVLSRPADPFGLGDIVARVKAERRAANERWLAEHNARVAPLIKAPTREERAAELRSTIYVADAALADLDNTQRWGRWTAEQYAAKCEPHRAAKAMAMALLADLEGVQ